MSFFEKLFSKFNKKTTSDIVQFNNNSHINPFGFVDSQLMLSLNLRVTIV